MGHILNFIEPPFSYTGSKFKMLEQLLPKFDYTKQIFVDLFSGGGSVYTNVLDKYKAIIVNDIIGDLISIHKELMDCDKIIENTKRICPSKEDQEAFLTLRESYNNEPTPDKLWALMLSSTNNMIRFNQKFKYNQTFGKRTWNKNTEEKTQKFIEHIRPFKNKVKYISKSFHEVAIVENGMYYCDYPYGYTTDENGNLLSKQISESGYNAFWKKDDEIKLYEYLHKLNNSNASFAISGVLFHDKKEAWVLSRLIKDGFSSEQINYDYNKVSRKGDKETYEILIKNY
jgi:DNA adenine methylase Dam